MRILAVTPQVGQAWGGIGTYVTELSARLGRSHSVFIATAGERLTVPGAQQVISITRPSGVMGGYARFQLAMRRQLPALLRELRPDIVLVNHAEMPDLLIRDDSRGPPRVVTAHTCLRTQFQAALRGRIGGGSLDGSEATVLSLAPALLSAEGRYWKRVRNAIFVSSAIQEDIARYLRPHLRHSFAIPNGVNLNEEATHAQVPGEFERDSGSPRILFAARLLASKGLGILIEALRELSNVQWECLVAGPGDSRPWESRLRAIGMASRIRFLGQLPRGSLLELMRRCDIFVLPSFSESCPFVLLEAMSCRLPTVASGVGDIPEIVEEGRSGLLATPGDPHQLARYLWALVENERLRLVMGARGRAIIEQRYSAEKMAESTASAFETILADEAGARRERSS